MGSEFQMYKKIEKAASNLETALKIFCKQVYSTSSSNCFSITTLPL